MEKDAIKANLGVMMTKEEIRALREQLELSQERFARRLRVSFVTVNRWEAGKARPSLPMVRRLERLEKKYVEAPSGEI